MPLSDDDFSTGYELGLIGVILVVLLFPLWLAWKLFQWTMAGYNSD
jgi:hypothetical protein